MPCTETGPTMYSVHQPWDPLNVCVVGRSYPPEFYSFITNSRVREVMERIAQETEEDYQELIKLLNKFNVKVVRPTINPDREFYKKHGRYEPPPMTPCDWSVMIGSTFYHNWRTRFQVYQDIKSDSWPNITSSKDLADLPLEIQNEIDTTVSEHTVLNSQDYQDIISLVDSQGNPIIERPWRDCGKIFNRAQISRIGKDLYFGTEEYTADTSSLQQRYSSMFPDYRCHVINTGGHSDGTYCPVKPGLIVSLNDVPTYADTFPDWEVVYLPGQSWDRVESFMKLKDKNAGKWWVPGEELNDEFTDFVESWLKHWVGYVEETVFDVNMLVIDEKNVVCNNYNKQVFDAFDRHGITPHIVNFRHRYFWDGGLHCITSDLDRTGTQKDYFPKRG
jgi:hypothetical protein